MDTGHPSQSWPPSPDEIDLNNRDWLSVGQAAGAAKVSERCVRRWIAERPIAIRVGGRIWISRARLFQQPTS